MQPNRRMRPLRWLLLGLFVAIIVSWNIWSWQYMPTSAWLHLSCTLLILVHGGIYWIAAAGRIRQTFSWLPLCIQIALILLLTQLTQLVIMALVLSLVFCIVLTLTLKQVFALVAALSGYFVLL